MRRRGKKTVDGAREGIDGLVQVVGRTFWSQTSFFTRHNTLLVTQKTRHEINAIVSIHGGVLGKEKKNS